MKVSSVSNVAYVPNSTLVDRLNAVRNGLRKYGAVVLQDTDMDQEIIRRLEKQFGKSNVSVEKSDNIKVSVSNFGGF